MEKEMLAVQASYTRSIQKRKRKEALNKKGEKSKHQG